MNREQAGQIVRRVWIEYNQSVLRPPQMASSMAPWSELDEWSKEVDRRIGQAVAIAAIAEAESIARAIKSPTAQLIADVIADLVDPGMSTDMITPAPQLESFQDAVRADPDMTLEQKAKWLSDEQK